MEYKDYMKAVKELNRQIAKIDAEYIKSVTKFKKGDTVSFLVKGDSYHGEPDDTRTGQIYGFEIQPDGSLRAGIYGHHQTPRLSELTLLHG